MDVGVRVVVVDADEVAAVEQSAVALVQVDPAGQRRKLVIVECQQVPLDAEVSEQRRRRPEGERWVRPVVCAVGGPTCAPEHFQRDQHRGMALDRLALEGVVAVARPHPFSALQDAEVDARPARRTALELDVGMAPAKFVE